MNQGISFKNNVYIGDGAWIGENVSIIGAKIGKNSIVGSNSVVLNDVEDFSIAVGSPAKVIKKYCSKKQEWIKVIDNES
jgi:acetyltransferase-like isoleucine patch superfamily enzyme